MKVEASEELLITAFLQEALPKIERVVTRAIRDGRSIAELAVNLERGADGRVRGGCAPREAVARRWLDDHMIPVDVANAIAAEVRATPPTSVPVVLTIATPQGAIIFGVKQLEGDVVAPDKAN